MPQTNTNKQRDKLIGANKEQKKIYNIDSSARKLNFIMKAWRTARRNMYYLLDTAGIWGDIYSLHKQWMGDLSGKKVLDFGCYEGNALSAYLASHSGKYVGVDLSENALARLDNYFQEKNG